MHLMQQIFPPDLDDFVIVFLDDILIYSKTVEDHQRHLKTVLQVLRDSQLYAKLSNCDFWKQEINFLGHIVTSQGIKQQSSHGLHQQTYTTYVRSSVLQVIFAD